MYNMFFRSGPSLRLRMEQWNMSIFQNEKVNKRLFYFFSVTRVFYFLCFCVLANHTRWLVITRSSNVLHTGKIQESTCLSLLLFLFFYLCHKTGKLPQSAWVGLLQMWFILCRFKIHCVIQGFIHIFSFCCLKWVSNQLFTHLEGTEQH